MKIIEFLDRIGQRRHERIMARPHKPMDVRMFVGSLFFIGYYGLVIAMMRTRGIPADNVSLIKDAMLVLGPVVGMIAQALFRTDSRDEQQTQNTGEAFRAQRAQAEATVAAVNAAPGSDVAGAAAGRVADAAEEEAAAVRDGRPEVKP